MILLINHTIRSGEHEFNGNSIIEGQGKEEEFVHEYYMDFYGEDNTDEEYTKAENYLYLDGSVCLKIDGWHEITKDQRSFLNSVNIY